MKAELFQPVMGTDLSVVNAARVSFDKVSDWLEEYDEEGQGFIKRYGKLKSSDVNLINYLARGMSYPEFASKIENIQNAPVADIEGWATELMRMAQHWVPFTHTAISLRMEAPYPIRVQCFKHKIGFTESEESRRYISSTPMLFMPDYFGAAVTNKKQGQGNKHPNSDKWLIEYERQCSQAIEMYGDMINDGIAPEEARFVLPLGCEVHWIWTGNLASFARYYNQRTDGHAQRQSRQLAKSVGEIIQPYFPVSWQALTG